MIFPSRFLSCTLFGLALGAVSLSADVVETKDGARLVGTIVSISEEAIELETAYAGTLTVQKAEVTGFSTEEERFVRLDSGTVMRGRVQNTGGGNLAIAGEDGTLNTRTVRVAAAWGPGQTDPAVVAESEKRREWRYLAGLNVSGKEGNTDEMDIGLNFEAVLEGPDDKLRFYGSIARSETDGVTTDEEIIGGVEFSSFVFGDWGWYVREELESDEFENVDLRSTTGAGLTKRFIKREGLELTGRAGLSFRYESYSDTTPNLEEIGLDFGLFHYWQFADWGEMTNELTYVPALEDFGDYRFTQDSGVNIPLGTSDRWRMRFGLKNEYQSEPSGNKEELDTTYYARLLLEWE